MPISEQTYERVALEDGDEQWELACGRLRKKPGMTLEHNRAIDRLARRLCLQLSEDEFVIRTNSTRTQISTGAMYVPDVCVVPREVEERVGELRPQRLEVYEEPLPLVVEVWSPSTGEYDVEAKLREYHKRGDGEIWRIHPYEKTLTTWRRQPDGNYAETLYREDAVVEPVALPGVRISLAELFR